LLPNKAGWDLTAKIMIFSNEIMKLPENRDKAKRLLAVCPSF